MNEFLTWNMRHSRLWETHTPLSDVEHDELFVLFDSPELPHSAMSAEAADGYLTACAVGPVPVPMHLWMEAIFGQPQLPVLADAVQTDHLLQLLVHRYQDIEESTAPERAKTATAASIYLPLSREVAAEDRVSPYQCNTQHERMGDWELKEWADGFRHALSEDDEWLPMLNDVEASVLLSPVLIFQTGYNPSNPTLQIDTPAVHEDLVLTLIQCVYAMRVWWRDHNRVRARVRATMDTPNPYLRQAPKPGRNDPCPCNSGKKYKKCCGA